MGWSGAAMFALRSVKASRSPVMPGVLYVEIIVMADCGGRVGVP